MIRFVRHKDIDPAKWDSTIRKARFSTIFATYDVLNLLTHDGHWNALILDDYLYVLPLPFRSKLKVPYIYSPFFLSQLGIFSEKEITDQITSDFFNAIPKKYFQVDLLLNTEMDYASIESFTISLISHKLDLSAAYEDLHQQYNKNTQRNLKSEQNKPDVSTDNRDIIAETIDLFVSNKGKEKSVHFKSSDYKLLMQTAQYLQENNLLETYGAYVNGKLISGALFVKDFDRYWFWFSGRDNHYASYKPMFFIMDVFIRNHASEPFMLDFNGSMNENVARLYKGFGGQPYSIPMIIYSRRKYLDILLKLYRKIKH